MNSYGKELILDLHNCDVSTFNRKSIRQYLVELCDLIDMQREDLHWWDYEGDSEGYDQAPAHLKGTSCVQFITTSNITIHTKDVLKTINIDIFSCKNFKPEVAKKFSEEWFGGETVNNNGDGYFFERY